MNVVLTKDLEALVNSKIRQGVFHSPEEVVQAALRLLEDGPGDGVVMHSTQLDREIQKGLDDIAAGNVIPGDVVEADLRRRSQQRRGERP